MSLATLKTKVEQLIEKTIISKWLQEAIGSGGEFRISNSTISYFPTGLDFSNVWSMKGTFANCVNLKSIPDIGSTAKVKSFDSCWDGCTSLTNLPPLDMSSCTNLSYAFRRTKIKTLILSNTNKVTVVTGMLGNCNQLETISELNFESMSKVGSSWNGGCIALKNITFTAQTIKGDIGFASSVLTPKSVQSIIDGLAPVETTQTLTFNSTITANLTDEQNVQILSKNWTVV